MLSYAKLLRYLINTLKFSTALKHDETAVHKMILTLSLDGLDRRPAHSSEYFNSEDKQFAITFSLRFPYSPAHCLQPLRRCQRTNQRAWQPTLASLPSLP